VTVALVDYGAGNLTSVRKALAALGADVHTPTVPAELERSGGVIVPGVGHFNATAALDERWREAVRSLLQRERPLLGICLGMQWLFEGSEEAPELPGLGLLPGRSFRLSDSTVKVPHVGWNSLAHEGRSRLLDGVAEGASAYFTHSFVVPESDATVARTMHGEPFPSVVEHDLTFGVQFHPEKSGAVGLQVLSNFLDACRQ
jgi:imidazole glycerol-phosphate synthase subunit HisH